jgi:hypothetical protein
MPAPLYHLGQMTTRGPITTVYDLGESVENTYEIDGVIYAEEEVELVESEEDAATDSDGSEDMEPAESGRDGSGAESGVVGGTVGRVELLQPAQPEPAPGDGGVAAGGAAED